MTHRTAADWYESGKEAWLLEDLARSVADAGHVSDGDHILDVGCGTGILTRECASRAGAQGSVSGIDKSEEMLAVATRIAPAISWYHGDAAALPFGDRSFDRVVSQLALMFFSQQETAVSEMWRVLKPGGTLAVAIYDEIPFAYQRLAHLAARHFGPGADQVIEARFALGSRRKVQKIFQGAGLERIPITTVETVQRFRSPAEFVNLEVRATASLAARLNHISLDAFIAEVEANIGHHVTGAGEVEIPTSVLLVTAHNLGR